MQILWSCQKSSESKFPHADRYPITVSLTEGESNKSKCKIKQKSSQSSHPSNVSKKWWNPKQKEQKGIEKKNQF